MYQVLTRFLYLQYVATNLKLSSSNIYLKEYLSKFLSLFFINFMQCLLTNSVFSGHFNVLQFMRH